ncbi:site-specific integrase [Novosphingobium sp. KCTC 2891]|uniref:tyrosine-type recombinase/integrase n=1 Tax=Novosphingobium sp. KCTC 2891 TaxID=2989730 RepID=UPI0022222E68|nr:site-specific integrase [Novosphingobium sp. KCTC 2891]MCW1381965.1 site-specific integrase [Novosphingobium sp. KCTC 2891]
MTSIRKRTWSGKGGEAKAAWQVDYLDAGGKRRSKQFKRKKDAEAWITQASWEVSKGIHTPDSQSITVEQAAKLWLDSVRNDNLEPTTVAAYEQHVRLHIVPKCGAKKLSQLTAPQVKQLLDGWVKTLSRPMATRVLRTFKAIITEAQIAGLVNQNVALAVKMKRAPREKSQVVIPTKADLRAILNSAAEVGGQAQVLVLLMMYTGMRASELRGLPWTNVDLRRAYVSVTQRADAHGAIGAPKSRTSHRTIPLPKSVVAALKAWKLACPPNDYNLVFPSERGKVTSHGIMVKTLLNPIQVAAGTTTGGKEPKPKYTPHDFRHAAASMWIEEKLNPKRIQSLMGHSSIQMTFDTYGHLFERAQHDTRDATAIERAINSDAT